MTAVIIPSDDGYTALIDETELLPVTGFYDEDGCSCSFDDATMAVAGPDANGLFVHIDLDPGTERLN